MKSYLSSAGVIYSEAMDDFLSELSSQTIKDLLDNSEFEELTNNSQPLHDVIYNSNSAKKTRFGVVNQNEVDSCKIQKVKQTGIWDFSDNSVSTKANLDKLGKLK